MEVQFADDCLDRLEIDEREDCGLAQNLVKAFRMRIQGIRGAPDERTFYQMRSWRFEKLKGKRSHQHSIRLNDQYRLIVELQGNAPSKTVIIVGVEDYH